MAIDPLIHFVGHVGNALSMHPAAVAELGKVTKVVRGLTVFGMYGFSMISGGSEVWTGIKKKWKCAKAEAAKKGTSVWKVHKLSLKQFCGSAWKVTKERFLQVSYGVSLIAGSVIGAISFSHQIKGLTATAFQFLMVSSALFLVSSVAMFARNVNCFRKERKQYKLAKEYLLSAQEEFKQAQIKLDSTKGKPADSDSIAFYRAFIKLKAAERVCKEMRNKVKGRIIEILGDVICVAGYIAVLATAGTMPPVTVGLVVLGCVFSFIGGRIREKKSASKDGKKGKKQPEEGKREKDIKIEENRIQNEIIRARLRLNHLEIKGRPRLVNS
ncbi:MAG: hypothetical protein ACI9S8_002310 [Chlamydiales bacterium]|jgi:hypothetical protein